LSSPVMSYGEVYAWTCGDDTEISHQKPIGSGGSGEVHEVRAHPIWFKLLFSNHKRIDGFQNY
jgi:hypothetical protein